MSNAPITFDAVFKEAMGGKASGFPPYDYQRRLAEDPDCRSRLIEIPTGLGKTAAVVLAWLWNRVVLKRADWPRRLVYGLPMRTLVEQTEKNVREWLDALGKAGLISTNISVQVLMGGEESDEWDLHPEKETILIGTQDMLLSRALNRGYGMSRYRWPMHFSLLNNDALWIMDETQLMGVSVETSSQLDGFRSRPGWTPFGACPTWWMSATLDAKRLATVDHPVPAGGWPKIELSSAERSSGEVQQRYEAKKAVSKATLTLSGASKKDYARQLAAVVAEKHIPGTLTLVIVNRVSRAQDVYAALHDKKLKLDPTNLALIHSRFRPVDRERHTRLLFGEGNRIVIATQAVEAGVDVSARLLVTELAPWSSLVQRIGRCNRKGERTDAEVLWIDVQPKDDKDDLALPYSVEEMKNSRLQLEKLPDAGPQSLVTVTVPEPKVIRPVLRRRDLVDLFDTTPDLCGQDLDISRYIRDGEDSDVQFFWRTLAGDRPTEEEPAPTRTELCRVSIGEAAKFFKKDKTDAWRWNPLEKVWDPATRPHPGAVYLVSLTSGGYSDAEGWTGDSKSEVTPYAPMQNGNEAYAQDPLTYFRHWHELDRHTAEVVEETAKLCASLGLPSAETALLQTAARWHDVGKAHEKFQEMLCGDEADRLTTLWAKSALRDGKHGRPGLRHELASALAWLLTGSKETPDRDLIAYIIAAHHGKVRLSIRALPDEKGPSGNGDQPFARGIWHGEHLRAVTLPGVPSDPLRLDLSFMQMGDGPYGPSWLARTINLRDQIGPFRLAYLETLLRAADMRASASAAAAAQLT